MEGSVELQIYKVVTLLRYWQVLATYSKEYFRNLGQRSILARKDTFYEKGNFYKNCKKGKLSIVERNLNPKYAPLDFL